MEMVGYLWEVDSVQQKDYVNTRMLKHEAVL